MKVDILASTDGKGHWSEEERIVRIVELKVGYLSTHYYPEDPVHGELRAYFVPDGFNPLEWNVQAYGLIYTDRKWIREFKLALRDMGFTVRAVRDVGYSEQGMQGDNYVSMDFGPEFYKSWQKLEAKKAAETANKE